MIILKDWFFRLGNNIIQLCNIIDIALADKHNIIFEKEHSLFNLKIITDYFSKYNNDEILTDKDNFFFACHDGNEHGISFLNRENKIIKKKLIRDSFLIKNIDKLNENYLVIHIRGGDIFKGKGGCNLYAPPPLIYYTKQIDKRKYEKIILVCEDKKNPVVDKLLSLYKNAIHNINSLEQDIRLILGATNLIYSVGTFIPSLMTMSENIKNIYGFMWPRDNKDEELIDYYRITYPWYNTKIQRDYILTYNIPDNNYHINYNLDVVKSTHYNINNHFFIVYKKKNKLKFIDYGGYENRNYSTMWCINEANKLYDWKDFENFKVYTGNKSCRKNELGYIKNNKNDNLNLVPDFLFCGWPEIGIYNYQKYIKLISEAGKNPPATNLLGWVGNFETYSYIKNLYKTDILNEEKIDISIIELVSKYKYLIYIREHNDYSPRLKLLLWSHRPLLLVEKKSHEYFEKNLIPWEHFIPVKSDLSDLIKNYNWCINNENLANKISENAYQFCIKNLTQGACFSRWNEIINSDTLKNYNFNYFTIVVSRYNEDVDWINKIVDNKYIDNVIIFNKGKNNISFDHIKIEVIIANNIGREGGTYLDYIIENYNIFPENLIFTQADPFEHNDDFLNFFEEENISLYINKEILPLTTYWKKSENIPPRKFVKVNNCYNIGNLRLIKFFVRDFDQQVIGHSNFFDEGVNWTTIGFNHLYKSNNKFKTVCDLIDIEPSKKIIPICLSACFFVKSKQILRHPKEVYIKLRKFLYNTNNQGGSEGYILERFWYYLFTEESYDTIDDSLQELFQGIEPIIKVYCDKRKKIWLKNINRCNKIVENPNTYIIYNKNGEQKILPGVDYEGPDLSSIVCDNIKLINIPYNILKLVSNIYKNNINNPYIKIYCKKRKKVWFKNINVCTNIVENPNTYVMLINDGKQKILSGIDYIGPYLSVKSCDNFELAEKLTMINHISKLIRLVNIINPIVKIYCKERKKVWFKNINTCTNIVENPNTYLIYNINGKQNIFEGVDYIGQDLSVKYCHNLEMAKNLHTRNSISYLIKQISITDPIIKIYCKKRKKIWFKNINSCSNIVKNPNTYIIYNKNNRQRVLLGVDYNGPDLSVKNCYSFDMAIKIKIPYDIFELIKYSNKNNPIIKVYCKERKQVWFKNIYNCNLIIKNSNINIIYNKDGEQKILSGIDIIGPDLSVETCRSLEMAKQINIDNPIIKIYCKERKKVWFKHTNNCNNIYFNSNTYIIYNKDGEQKILPGVDYEGPDLSVKPCDNLELAKKLNIKNPIPKFINKVNTIDYIIKIYCKERKLVWFKDIQKCSEIVDNPNTFIMYKISGKEKILPGIDYKGPCILVKPCDNLKMANQIVLNNKNNINETEFYFYIRGHIRKSFNTNRLRNFIYLLKSSFPNIIFILQTWNHDECNKENSWKRKDIKQKTNIVNKSTINNYFQDMNLTKNTLIIDEKTIKLVGSTNGLVSYSFAPKRGWKNMWYGIYTGLNHFNLNNKKMIVSFRFDYFDISQSKGINEDDIIDFINKHLNTPNIKFIQHNVVGTDNLYMGSVNKMKALTDRFHFKLDDIIKEYPDTPHQEYLVNNIAKYCDLL